MLFSEKEKKNLNTLGLEKPEAPLEEGEGSREGDDCIRGLGQGACQPGSTVRVQLLGSWASW